MCYCSHWPCWHTQLVWLLACSTSLCLHMTNHPGSNSIPWLLTTLTCSRSVPSLYISKSISLFSGPYLLWCPVAAVSPIFLPPSISSSFHFLPFISPPLLLFIFFLTIHNYQSYTSISPLLSFLGFSHSSFPSALYVPGICFCPCIQLFLPPWLYVCLIIHTIFLIWHFFSVYCF